MTNNIIYSYQNEMSSVEVDAYSQKNNKWWVDLKRIRPQNGYITISFSLYLDPFQFPQYENEIYSNYCSKEFWDKIKEDIEKLFELKEFI